MSRSSPLNVVVSGLEFLKDEVKALSGSLKDRVECLIHEMTVASKSAVHILTDVLDYELIDSGELRATHPFFRFADACNEFRLDEAQPPVVSFGSLPGE